MLKWLYRLTLLALIGLIHYTRLYKPERDIKKLYLMPTETILWNMQLLTNSFSKICEIKQHVWVQEETKWLWEVENRLGAEKCYNSDKCSHISEENKKHNNNKIIFCLKISVWQKCIFFRFLSKLLLCWWKLQNRIDEAWILEMRFCSLYLWIHSS